MPNFGFWIRGTCWQIPTLVLWAQPRWLTGRKTDHRPVHCRSWNQVAAHERYRYAASSMAEGGRSRNSSRPHGSVFYNNVPELNMGGYRSSPRHPISYALRRQLAWLLLQPADRFTPRPTCVTGQSYSSYQRFRPVGFKEYDDAAIGIPLR